MLHRDIIKRLEEAGWRRYLCASDHCHWKYSGSNRFVDIDGPYIDIYVYSDAEKYGTYLTIPEMELFARLAIALEQDKSDQE